MDSSLTLQNQIRNNAEELQNYLKDLSLWNTEMKRKEVALETNASYSKEIPPIRSRRKKVKKVEDNGSFKEKSQRISALDYSSWEKFDIEKACDEVDADSSQSDSELEVPPQVQHRLREEASFEKEKGNQYVKNQKWDDAIKCYTRAIKCYSQDPIFYANRALCFLKKKDFRATEADCTSALQLDDTYVKAYQRRAAARIELSQVQEAMSDLRKVLELEPKNSASKQELAKLEKKNLNRKQVVTPASQESRIKNLVDAVPGPSGLSQLKKAATKQVKCSMNQGIVDKNKTEATSNDKPAGQGVIVKSIQKPPHLRSKKPLRRIKIEEFHSMNNDVKESILREATTSEDQKFPESQTPQTTRCDSSTDEQISPSVQTSGQHSPTDRTLEVESEDLQAQVPPAPVSSVQFLVGWSKVKDNSKLVYLYLKQISGAELPKLFQDSLESNILSGILKTLTNEFTKEGSAVYSYLLGLSKVRRFSTLSFFLTKEEKECVRKLLDFSLSREECTTSEAALLREKYEL